MQIKYCLYCGCMITEEQATSDIIMRNSLSFIHADWDGCRESIRRIDNDDKYGESAWRHRRVTYAGGLHFQ